MKIRRGCKTNIYVQYTVLFSITAFFTFGILLLRHSSFVVIGDSFNQFYPVLTYLSRYYRDLPGDLLSGSVKMFDSTLGFGDDVIGALSYYGLGDIFLLPAVLCPARYMSYAYTLIAALRIYAAGITFIIYAKSRKMEKGSILFGALAYAYSYYMLGIGMTAFNFITAPVYFPLLIGGIEHISANDESSLKWQKILLVTVFLQALNGFYFLYIDILGCFVYVIFICCKKMIHRVYVLKDMLTFLIKLFYTVCLGIGLAGTLFIPVVYEYIQSPRQGDSTFSLHEILSFPTMSEFAMLLKGVIYPVSSAYARGLSLPIISIIVILFILMHYKKMHLAGKLVFIAVAVYSYIFPAFGVIASGFEENSSRWFYMLLFLMIVITTESIPIILEQFSTVDVYINLIVAVLFAISAFVLYDVTKGMLVRTVIYAGIWIMTVYLIVKGKKHYEKIIWLVAIANVCITGFYSYAPEKIGGMDLGTSFKALNFVYSEIADTKLGKIAKENTSDADEFIRYDVNDTSLDAPAMFGINSTFMYYSLCNGSTYNIYNELRISPGINDMFTVEGLDARQIPETLMSVKTYALDNVNYPLAENQYYLPLGFAFDHYVIQDEIQNLTQLQKMNLMMDHLILDNDSNNLSDAVQIRQGQTGGTTSNVPVSLTYSDGIKYEGNTIEAQKGASIHLSFKPIIQEQQPGKELYLYMRNLTAEPSFEYYISIADRRIRLRPKETEWYYHNNFDYLVNVQSTASTGEIDITFNDAGKYNLDSIELVENSTTDFERKYENLKAASMQNLQISNNKVSGTTEYNTKKWLFISYPYSKGWSCKIDGKNAPIVRADYSFMAVEVPKGEHSICFSYCTPGITIGLIVSILSFIIVLVLFKIIDSGNVMNKNGEIKNEYDQRG